MNGPKKARDGGSPWSTVAVIAAIVAAGTVVAGLTNDPQSDAVAIPGCDEVVQPEEMHRINCAFVVGNDYPEGTWISEAKASAMTSALRGALPEGTAVVPDEAWPPLVFEPAGNDLTATGKIVMDGVVGDLTVAVRESDEPAGPCFAGFVDERRTVDDGTVIDISAHRVLAYATDGSAIDVNSRHVLTPEQLVVIATTPEFRVSAPA